jgi:c-di-GMP-binding flagellar brake protein YcgR
MQFTGQVIRVIPPYDEGFPQIISVQFVTIKSNEQQYLIRYCFERQIELRKRGYYD